MTRRYLELSLEDRERLADLGLRLETDADQIISSVAAALADAEELTDVLPPGDLAVQLRPALVAYLASLKDNQVEAYLERISTRIRERAESGVTLEGMVVAVMAFEAAVTQLIRGYYRDDAFLDAVRGAFLKFNHIVLTTATSAYLAGKEETILAQQKAMLALSTPVVEIWEGVLALPLVGTIDTARARQITQSLLRTIQDTQAHVVILDISGVPLVDTKVANHLIKTIRAARLLGARGIVVGISPEIADTLIALDITFEGIETYFSLRQGLEAVLRQRGLTVVSGGGRQ